MHHYIVHDVHGRVNESPVQLDTAVRLTAAPSRPIVFDLNLRRYCPDSLFVDVNAKIQLFHRPPIEPLLHQRAQLLGVSEQIGSSVNLQAVGNLHYPYVVRLTQP